ncbi:hypothetical protein PR202_ga28645 [Eleusine coracana subsp. coracana]|uniref:DUF7378 domain-containing protein n=1 Tax=Eleusine coracana subsp. coracana TaxID=191504 RepID=A0AAV5DHN7_ELECO|nr:hypothetical protein PR202_ga28645 [Eleusine coracana subsp. coracana]
MAMTPAPLLTVGDLNAQSNVSFSVHGHGGDRGLLHLPQLGLPRPLHRDRVLAAAIDAVAVVSELMMYLHLFLPRTPLAVREALRDVGLCWVGFPLSWMAVLVTF